MSLDPDQEPITRPVLVWLEATAQLMVHGDRAGDGPTTAGRLARRVRVYGKLGCVANGAHRDRPSTARAVDVPRVSDSG